MAKDKLTIGCGRHYAQNVNIAKSLFHDVNLSKADFNDVCLSGAKFHNINLSDIKVTTVQMGGAFFRHVGLPRGSKGKQRVVKFVECDLNGSMFKNCALSNVKISDCDCSGMKINGILLTELLTAHARNKKHKRER